jgi:hypothetical protein
MPLLVVAAAAATVVISPLGFKILFMSEVSQITYKANPSIL